MIPHIVANLCFTDDIMRTSKIHDFSTFNQILLKFSLTSFSHVSTFIKTKLISGWTSLLRYINMYTVTLSFRLLFYFLVQARS